MERLKMVVNINCNARRIFIFVNVKIVYKQSENAIFITKLRYCKRIFIKCRFRPFWWKTEG